MTNKFPRQTVHAAGNCLALAAALILLLQPFNGWAQTIPAAAGQPSQKPLITRDGGQPSPNVMLTLDTSWSMIFPYLPEGEFTVNGKAVKFPGFNSPIMHPDDTRYTKTTGSTPARTDGNGGVIPADLTASDDSNVFQRQMRSPDVNQLYYNPRQLYQPWLKSKDVSTGKEKRYDAALPGKAWFDPNKQIESPIYYADLTKAASKLTAVWCQSNPTNAGGNLSCSQSEKWFSPAVYFLLTANADPTKAVSYTLYDINGAKNDKPFTKYTNRIDCAADPCTQAEERQNYANWFVYYRTRLHTAEAAIPEAFLQLDNNKIRVGWGTIHQASHDVDGVNNTIVQSGLREFDSTRKDELVEWIRNFRGSEAPNLPSDKKPELASRTPLLGALDGVGKYFERTDSNGPWATNPGLASVGSTTPLACRRAYNMLITDGYYTDTSSETNQDNEKGPTITNNAGGKPTPATYAYAPAPPFADEKSGTLADVAMKYWKNDLQSDIPNKLPHGNDTPLEDPAFWQHLVQFPIGLGVEGNIPLKDLPKVLSELTAKSWWKGDANKAKIDDLLHAAVNSRGQYFSAKNSSELVDALSSALSRTAVIPNLKEGGVGVTTTVLGDEKDLAYVNAKYVPEYTAGSWIGDVKAYALNFNGVVIGTQASWIASEHVPAYASRNIITWDKQTQMPRGGEGVQFTWEDMGKDNQALVTLPPGIDKEKDASKFINYIRGDASNEDSSGVISLFRQRTGKLPDFINSNPVLLKGNVALGYDQLPNGVEGQRSYGQFVTAKAARQPVLFVGGNGGMLHAFADYSTTGVVPGQEVFAYVPRTLLPKLNKLALRTYGKAGNEHSYYVDGPLVESDAYLSGGWKNILLGTLGAGGKGLFALDVTTPSAMGPSSILWERSSEDDEDIGYIFSAPQLGILPNNQWVVFAGNGAHSGKGKAVLLQINLSTGVLSKTVVDSDGGNGLGGVTLVKNINQQVIGAYAGDLKGNVWRFNVSDAGVITHVKLYTAQKDQPITAAPAVTTNPIGGYLVVVGTGKLYDEGDNDDHSKQSVYGLWDKTPTGTSAFTKIDTPLANLVQQTVGVSITDKGGIYYPMSANEVDYGKPDVLGWYIDLLIEPGQRLIYPPTIIKNYVLIGTMAPAATATFCDDAKGHGYNYLVPALTGGASKVQVLDTNGDGLVTTADQSVAVYTTDADGGDVIVTKPDTKGGTNCSIQNTGNSQGCYLPPPPCLDPKTCQQSIKSRVWRQIFNPPHP